MKLEFDSIDEVKAFYAQLKGTRGKKGDDADEAAPTATATVQQVPAPMAVPTTFPSAGFAPPVAGAAQTAQVFPAPVATGPAPEVLALVNKIITKLDDSLAAGNAPDAALNWFRTQCGPEAAQATMDQIKTHFLPRMAQQPLEFVAKQMGIV